jgi:hypothetical protein
VRLLAEVLSPKQQCHNIIICPIAVHSPGVSHEVAVPPAKKLYHSIAILVI